MVTCSVVSNCTGEAVLQSAVDCKDKACKSGRRQIRDNIAQRQAERDATQSRIDAITTAARTRDGGVTDLENRELRTLHDRLRDLGGEIEGLTAAARHVEAAHTHPAFACKKHADKLGT